jgi:dTDP-4-amino-4,6-dideoxygalactose transaminase
MKYTIPFNRAACVQDEMVYVTRAIQSGRISGDNEFTAKCSRWLQEFLGVEKALLTTSCTHALEMSALLLDIHPGDEVIVPSFTFVSTVNAYVLRGARPVFADIREDTLNIDPAAIAKAISPKTRAILVVHYAGIGCDMDAIRAAVGDRSLPVVEDSAHGLFGKYRGRFLGTFGPMATLSFHETKNVTCGEGGALLINDKKLIERAEIIREKGTDRSRFFRGQVDKYGWVDVGSSYLPSDVLAAYLLGQLEASRRIQEKRRSIWQFYREQLHDWAGTNDVRLPHVPDDCEQSYHMFYLLMPTAEARTAFISHMKERGILCVFHYLPLHLSAMGRRFGGENAQCPVTVDVSDRLVRLPFFFDLTGDDLSEVARAARSFSAPGRG